MLAPDGSAFNDEAKGGATRKRGKRTPQRDILIGLTESVELWHDLAGDAYATFSVNGHRENLPVRGGPFADWLGYRFYLETGAIIGGQALKDGLGILANKANYEGPEYPTWRRVGRLDGSLYLDLGDKSWRAVEITANGWAIVDEPPVKFLRSHSMRPLPAPAEEGKLADLRPFINVASEDDFVLIQAWLIGALRETGPFPILFINGEQGSSKSNVTRVLRSLIDPSAATIRAAPKDNVDLIISADNNRILAFDNLSSSPGWFSDAIARVSTSGGYAARKLYSDREEVVLEAMRPIIINGIPDLATQADVASRSITVELPAIPEDIRRTKSEFFLAFEEAHPVILAGLLDAVSCAMRRLEDTKLDRMPRMADFARFVVAAEDGEIWEAGRFLSAYEANRETSANVAFESDSFATALRDWFFGEATSHLADEWISQGRWEGEPSRLLEAINSATPETMQKSKWWPKDAARLGSRRRRMADGLRRVGIEFDMKKGGHNSRRNYIITDIRHP